MQLLTKDHASLHCALPSCLIPKGPSSHLGGPWWCPPAPCALLQCCTPASRSPWRWFPQVQVHRYGCCRTRRTDTEAEDHVTGGPHLTSPHRTSSDAEFVAGGRQDPRPHRLVVVGREPRNAIAPAPHRRGRQRRDCGRGSVHGARAAGATEPRASLAGWLAVAAGKAAAARPGGLSLLPLPATQTHTSRHAQCPWPSMRKGIRCPDAVRPATLSLPSASGLCCS